MRRDREHLVEAAENIDRWCGYVLGRQFKDTDGWELQNMLIVARLIIEAALRRKRRAACIFAPTFPSRTTPIGNAASSSASAIDGLSGYSVSGGLPTKAIHFPSGDHAASEHFQASAEILVGALAPSTSSQ